MYYVFRASLLEEYKENINEFTKQIDDKKNYLHQLEQTKRVNESSSQCEQKTLEKKLFNLKQKLENEREKLKTIDKLLSIKNSPIVEESQSSKSNPIPISNLSACDDDNSLSRAITTKSSSSSSSAATSTDLMSKSFNENMFFNRSKIEVSYFDFNLTTESLPRNSKIAPQLQTDKTKSITHRRITESNDAYSPLMMPKFNSNSLSSINYVNDNTIQQTNISSVNRNNNCNNSNDNHNNTNNNVDNIDTVVVRKTADQSRQMTMAKLKRPLTRFLPDFSLDFNLRNHIENAGHQIQLCPHLLIDGELFV